MKISIVGGGATGIAMLRCLADQACSDPARYGISAIQLFDKSGFDGGMAYRTDSNQHLLNMKMSTMSISAGDPDDFLRWAARSGLLCDGTEHMPRKLYRTYLNDVRDGAIERCRDAGIEVHVEQAEIVRLHVTAADDVTLTTDRHVSHTASVAILCTGHHAPDDRYGLSASPNYIGDPYAAFRVPDRADIAVGIIGSGLTAVDSVLALASTHGSVGITCFSRSGLFPTVQLGTRPRENAGFRATLESYVKAHDWIGADDFAGTISEALLACTGFSCDLSQHDAEGDALTNLERNLAWAEKSDSNIPSCLSTVADLVCEAWNKMDRVEKTRFMDAYNAGWLRNRSAMPLANGLKLRDLLRSGQLTVVPRLRDIVDTGRGFRAHLAHGDFRDVDHVIAATGPSYRLDAAPLYRDMQQRGLVVFDELGGMFCDYKDGRVLDSHGRKHRHVFAVGGPTKGTYFYAAAIDINLCRAKTVVDAILGDARLARPARPRLTEVPRQIRPSFFLQEQTPMMTIAGTTSIDAADELDRLADLVRRQHRSLDTLMLAPDGKYQTRTVAMDALMRDATDCLATGFRDRDPNDLPMIYCAWGKCRVGSTALTNLFGVAGMPSFFQPVKTILRHSLMGRPGAPWLLPSASVQPHVFSKEMAGPYVLAESLFLSLQPLIEAGYPAERLHFIMLDRDPASSLVSWIEKWSDRVPDHTLMQNYVIAALNTRRVEDYARQHGIPVTHFVYEASKEPVQSIRRLFERLGLADRFSEGAVTDWNEMGKLESESARITFVKEPTVYTVPGLHGSDTAYRYRSRSTGSLSDTRLQLLERYGIHDIYRASITACVRDLGLTEGASERLFGRITGAAA